MLAQRFCMFDLRGIKDLLTEHRELRRALWMSKASDCKNFWRAKRALTLTDFEFLLDGAVRLVEHAGFWGESVDV